MSDYLAIINAGGGIGSWARGADKQTTIDNVIRIFRADWKTILKPQTKTPQVTVVVYDVEGYDSVAWDDRALWSGKKQIEPPFELVEHIYPRWK